MKSTGNITLGINYIVTFTRTQWGKEIHGVTTRREGVAGNGGLSEPFPAILAGIMWTGSGGPTTSALQIRTFSVVVSWAPYAWSKQRVRRGVVVQIATRGGTTQGNTT